MTKSLALRAAWLAFAILLASGCSSVTRSEPTNSTQNASGDASTSGEHVSAGAPQIDGMPHASAPTLPALTPTSMAVESSARDKIDKSQFRQAPQLTSNTWINSAPLTLAGLRGHVVVVSFWTFACYNCQNTLPYFKAWDQKYRDRGLVIIGVHTPELSFEQDIANVRKAVQDDGLQYPIAVDGDYANWDRYRVRAWPTWFIVDKEGYIRYSHIGEGDYARSEQTIAALLDE